MSLMEGVVTNSMDEIIVRFGSKRISEVERNRIERAKLRLAEINQDDQLSSLKFFKKEKIRLQKIIATDMKSKTLPLIEFLKLDASDLSAKEQQLQRVLLFLYKQNESSIPLYKKFPKRECPLVIDCTIIPNANLAGLYSGAFNTVIVGDNVSKDEQLVATLAHELKHAEHFLGDKFLNYNSYQIHQISFLKEAQATACGDWVLRQYKKEFQIEEAPEIKLLLSLFGPKVKQGTMASSDMPFHLNKFLDNERYACVYKDEYDVKHPILYTEKGLTRIPSVFGIEKKDEVRVLKILNSRIPRRARTPDNQVRQALENNDIKTIKTLMAKTDKSGKHLVSDHILMNLMLCDCYKNLALYDAVLKSNRLTKEDKNDLLGSIFHFSDGLVCDEIEMDERKKVFKKLVSEKDEKGNFVFSSDEVMEWIDFSETIEEDEKAREMAKFAKSFMKKRSIPKVKNKMNNYTK